MAELDGDLSLGHWQISIPGTHDTMAQGNANCMLSGLGNAVHTQTWSLRTQLDAGIRFVDIRMRHEYDQFSIEHSSVALPFMFGADVLDVVFQFLADNPSETLIMRGTASEEYSAGGNTRTSDDTLAYYIAGNPDGWITSATMPTLDEARGKIVWYNSLPTILKQDNYELTTDLSFKKSSIRDTVKSMVSSTTSFSVNYFSGSTGILPLNVAGGLDVLGIGFTGTNKIAFEYSGGFTGISVFDFPGEDVVQHIFSNQGLGAPQWTPDCYADGIDCAIGSGCNECCSQYTYWNGKLITACGTEPCWEDGTLCLAGTTCSTCCNPARESLCTVCGGPEWNSGETCAQGTTCDCGCGSKGYDCPWFMFGFCRCN
eukprot:TRINITY_DN2329_c0_g1_i3.p1 TRINITY_DN2329_c0_g1~~TRINITY_DN2329_c0_g1_i3.p1  ORF type:complete len:371 (+),score=60.89 TRINITY_DN2329_c0_g1_i3:688-1800(+)